MKKNDYGKFNWLNPQDRKQIEWLASYMQKQASRIGRLKRENESLSYYAYELIDYWCKNKNPKKVNTFTNKVKNAWVSYSRNSQNCTIACPIKYKEYLDELAKREDVSRSSMIVSLIDKELNRIDEVQRINEINSKLSEKISDLEKQLEEKDNKFVELQKELDRIKNDRKKEDIDPIIEKLIEPSLRLDKEGKIHYRDADFSLSLCDLVPPFLPSTK